MSGAILEVNRLTVVIDGPRGPLFPVEDVSFSLGRGELVGLVGESGSGKTMIARAILGLLPPGARIFGGSVRLEGEELVGAPERRLCAVRGARLSLVFQEPASALNPVLSIGTQIAEVVRAHSRISAREARLAARAALERVSFPDAERALSAYPHQLSGGQRQRVLLAMALVLDPPVVIADEPTTALDPEARAEVVALLAEVRREQGTSVLFITHDLGLIERAADRVLVSYAGELLESAAAEVLFRAPRHPYTAALLAASPGRAPPGRRLPEIPGLVPPLGARPRGCRFADRCSKAAARCFAERPELHSGEENAVRCFYPEVSR